MDISSHHLLAICLDCGDTIVDEGTEIKDGAGVVLQAELIPGASEMVRTLRAGGYSLALVADGPVGTFRNVLSHYGLYDLFDILAISEQIGAEKPHPAMFLHALDGLGIHQTDYGRTVMVGNNLARDIKGANALGMITIWLDWAPRRSKVPANRSEVPDYIIKTPLELLPLIEMLDNG